MADEVKQEPTATPLTMANAVAIIRQNQEKDFDRNDMAERLRVGVRRSKCGHAGNNPLFGMVFDNPSIVYSLDELRQLVPLERDRLNYSFKATKEGGTDGMFAVNRHGLYSVPKPHGRLNRHMNLRQQAIKSEALRVFKALMDKATETLKSVCTTDGIEYLGVPESTTQELAQKAMRFALRNVSGRRKEKSKAAHRRQEHSRKVNAGLLTLATSEKNYVSRGGQYGA